MKRWLFWALASFLFVILGYFSLTKLTQTPPTWYDEGANEQVAMNEALHGKAEVQIAPGQFISSVPWVTTGYPALEPVHWSFDLFGIGLFQARVVMAMFILLCVAIYFYLILEKLPSELVAVSTRQPAIWHATAIEGCSCLWSVEKFLEYYKPVAAKQFI